MSSTLTPTAMKKEKEKEKEPVTDSEGLPVVTAPPKLRHAKNKMQRRSRNKNRTA